MSAVAGPVFVWNIEIAHFDMQRCVAAVEEIVVAAVDVKAD